MVRYRRYLIALAIVLVLVGAYAAAGFLAVPYFARKYAQDFARDHYGRTLSIGEIRFNPFTLNLDISRLSFPDADGKPMLAFGHLYVDLQLATLWRLGPSFGEIILTQPFAHVVLRPGGVLNLVDLEKGFAARKPGKPVAANEPSAPLRLYIGRLQVISGTATFEDRTRPTPFRADFTPIGFELRDFSTRGTTGNAYGLSAASPQGERLTWSGTVHLAPLSSQGTFEITDLKARTLWSYMRQSLPFEIDSGVIGLKGDYGLASHGGPMALSVNVHNTTLAGLGVKPAGGAQRYIDVARIELDDTRMDLTQHSLNVGKVTLSGGDIKVWLDEQRRLNLLELVRRAPPAGAAAADSPESSGTPPSPAPPPPPTTAAPGKSAATSWKVSVPDIRATGFKVAAEDRGLTPAATVLLAPVNLHVKGFNTAPDDTLDLTLDSGVNDEGKVSGQAKVTASSGAISAHLETEKLPLTALQPYLTHYTSMTLLKGNLGAKLDVERQADGKLEVKCNTSIHDVRSVDNALKQDFIKWRDLRIADIRYRSSPQDLRVGTVTALEPYVRMIVEPDRTINIVRILKPSGAAAPKSNPGTSPDTRAADTGAADTQAVPPARAAAKGPRRPRQAHVQTAEVPPGPVTPFPVSIGTVTLVNGSANYADLWIKPSFAIGIQSLGGTVKGLSSDPRSRAKVDLKGKVDRYSPIEIGGEANLLSAALYTDMKMSFQDLDLTVVNPYSGHFVGYRIAKGKLSVDVSYKIDKRQLTASQHFVVDQLELGERVESPDAVHLPLKIAVALLKDRNGVIDLNLPMSGSLDDPKFRVGPIIWKMFVNLITKAVTAPFALLGHMFGGGGNEHINIIQFDPGSAELDKPGREQLATLAKSLHERPQLKLEVPIVYSAELDREQLAAARLRSELLARELNTREGKKHPDTAGEIALADPQKHFRLLVDQFHADLGKDAPLPPNAAAVQQAGRKEQPSYDEAINDLNAAVINHRQVTDSDLEALGKQRAEAIEDALVSDGKVEAARVFIVNRAQPEAAKPPEGTTSGKEAGAPVSAQTSASDKPPDAAPDGSQADSAAADGQKPPPNAPAGNRVKVELSLR
jgi:hypothetical protein